MKWFAETTTWPDGLANGVYLLDDSKTKMYAYLSPKATEPKHFKNAIKIDTRGRKFIVNPVQYRVTVVEEVPEGCTFEVKGSKGDVYTVTEHNGNYSCSCSGFKFRGACRHITEAQNA